MRLSRHVIALALVVVVATATVGAFATAPHASAAAGVADQADDPDAGLPTGEVNRSDADVTIAGDGDDLLGKSVASVGDVNGDGYEDLAVGAPLDEPRTGTVYLFFGPIENESLNASAADAVLVGEERGDQAGTSIAAGDLDGDGYDDLVIGAPYADTNGRNAGTVYVVPGGEDVPSTANLTEVGHAIDGANEGDAAGYAVSVVDDAVGEPGADLVVGAPYADAGGEDAGAAYVLDGNAIENASDFGEADLTLVGESPGDRAGSAVDDAGDVNGDGQSDLVIGARAHGDADAGAAYIVTDTNASAGNASGANETAANETANETGTNATAPNATASNTTAVSLANATTRLTGAAPWDRAGISVAGVGDANGDGFDDVAVGAPTNDAGGEDAGAVHLVFGGDDLPASANLSAANATVYGATAGDRAGWSVAGPGDVTCDGFDDVLVGAPYADAGGEDAGAAYLVAGNATLAANGTLSNATTRVVGTESGGLTGWAVSAAGAPERGTGVLVGAPEVDDDAGAVSVFWSDCPDSMATPTPTPSPTPTETDAATDSPTPTATATDSPTSTESQASSPPETSTATPSPDDPATTTGESTGEDESPIDPVTLTVGLAAAGTATALLVRRRL